MSERRLSCNIKIIDERKKCAGQKEKIFIFAASKKAGLRHREGVEDLIGNDI
jgi:hypothetical protein